MKARSGSIKGPADNARLQLVYCRITSPIADRIGLRLVDVGNIIHANDTTGLAIIPSCSRSRPSSPSLMDKIPVVVSKLKAKKTGVSQTTQHRGTGCDAAAWLILHFHSWLNRLTKHVKREKEQRSSCHFHRDSVRRSSQQHLSKAGGADQAFQNLKA